MAVQSHTHPPHPPHTHTQSVGSRQFYSGSNKNLFKHIKEGKKMQDFSEHINKLVAYLLFQFHFTLWTSLKGQRYLCRYSRLRNDWSRSLHMNLQDEHLTKSRKLATCPNYTVFQKHLSWRNKAYKETVNTSAGFPPNKSFNLLNG